MTKVKEPSKKARNLVAEFGAAAEQAYWEEDQGTGSSVSAAAQERDVRYAALLKYIARLEAKAAR